MLVTEPSTGSKSRTKGNLYVLVSSAMAGGRARDAAAVAAQTIQREYYYDESAGIPILLEKCFRSANRKLRGRDGSGIQPGSIGIAVAVVRGQRAVRGHGRRGRRLPRPRGAPARAGTQGRTRAFRRTTSPSTSGAASSPIGDSVLLVAHRLVEAVGTEELKNAVVTLHPQSAGRAPPPPVRRVRRRGLGRGAGRRGERAHRPQRRASTDQRTARVTSTASWPSAARPSWRTTRHGRTAPRSRVAAET